MYRLHPTEGVIAENGEWIKPIRSSIEWIEYQDWVRAGGIPLPVEVQSESLESLFARRVSEVNERRDRIEQTFFMYLGKPFDSNSISAIRITTAAAAAQTALAHGLPVEPIEWTCFDNTRILLTAEQLITLPIALAEHSGRCHRIASIKKSELSALFDSGDRVGMEEYDIGVGWD